MSEKLSADLNIIQSAPIELELLDGDLNIIQKLDDEPNDVGGLTSAELKAKFDESGNIIKKYINETLIPAVLAEDATEESRKQAEAARVAAEQTRQTNEETRKSNEAARVTAEGNRATAEGTRANAETARVQNETERKTSEASRAIAETARANAEAQRQTNEQLRQMAENSRGFAETQRVNAEDTRKANETARVQAETSRDNAETQRQSNEAARQNAEAQRVSAENARNVWENYDVTKAYTVGNKVVYDGSSYLCIKPCISVNPMNSTYWRRIAGRGSTGPANALTIGSVTSGEVASATIIGDAPNQFLNLVLQQGEKGNSGVYVGAGDMPEGYNVQIDPSGSGDEIVTAESIESALGYTPADSNEVGQIKEDLSAKLDKPSTAPAVGKILKVTAVNEDGSFVCEWANAPSGGGAVDDVQVNGESVVADGVAKIPLAKMGSTGVVKFDAFMPFTFNAGALRLANADENELTNPRYDFSTNRAITASNYRLAVELAMCDGKGAAWTDAEKTGAWKRLKSIKTTMDEIAVAGAQYYLGEQTAVSVVLPDDAEVGQMVTVSWYNSATAATLSITGTMLAFDYTPSANTRSEINALWDGTYWAVLGNEMEVASDAETT